MSRTIITKSGSEFITSIGTERFIAILCKEVGAKYEEDPTSEWIEIHAVAPSGR